MDDITLNKDYRSLWEAARKKNNITALEQVFEDLANELGLPDTARDLSSAAAGQRLAEMLNLQGKGPEAKKL